MPRFSRAICLVVVSLSSSGCGDSSAPAAINAVGSWHGTTSQGRPITFTVTSAGVTGGTLSYALSGTSCSVEAELTVGSSAPAAITNNAFQASFDLGPSFGAVITVAGQFKSSTSASGTLAVNDSYCNGSVSVSWTAAKG